MIKKKILSVVGARPNFMKVAPIHAALCEQPTLESVIVHTGQHYDARMSDIFFSQLGLPKPHHYLGVEGGDSVSQISRVMQAFSNVLRQERPDMVLVVGDVNATAAAAITSSHLQVPVAHIEAGLRSFDKTMPEEINRMLTDSITDLFFVTEQSALDNLRNEGVDDSKIFFTGNVMIDTLRKYEPQATAVSEELLAANYLDAGKYVLMTMHRPSNVDTEKGLATIAEVVDGIGKLGLRVVWPVHPRTSHHIEQFQMQHRFADVALLPPLGYIEFVALMGNALAVLTDSGGVQEETTCLQVPCITFRSTTERPVTVTLGTNHLMADLDAQATIGLVQQISQGKWKTGNIPPLWDGAAASRIVKQIATHLNG